MSRIDPVPEDRLSETAITVAKAAMSAVPIVGGAAAELLGGSVLPVLERRRVAWLNDLADAVNELGAIDSHWAIENLKDNEAFASAVLTAVDAANRTSSKAKHEALRNAVLNSVAPAALDEYEQAMLLGFIEELTPWHLAILSVGADPKGWFEREPELSQPEFALSSSHSQLLEAAIPELKGQRELYDRAVSDLSVRGLAGTSSLHTMMTADAAWEGWATAMGRRLVAFATSPSL